MADTGYNWLDADTLTYNVGTDINEIAVADNATLLSDELDFDGAAACELSIVLTEDDTGACDETCDIYILGTNNGPGPGSAEAWQDKDDPGLLSFAVDVNQDETKTLVLAIDPKHYSSIKVYVDNHVGQTLDVSINYRFATIPVAS